MSDTQPVEDGYEPFRPVPGDDDYIVNAGPGDAEDHPFDHRPAPSGKRGLLSPMRGDVPAARMSAPMVGESRSRPHGRRATVAAS